MIRLNLSRVSVGLKSQANLQYQRVSFTNGFQLLLLFGIMFSCNRDNLHSVNPEIILLTHQVKDFNYQLESLQNEYQILLTKNQQHSTKLSEQKAKLMTLEKESVQQKKMIEESKLEFYQLKSTIQDIVDKSSQQNTKIVSLNSEHEQLNTSLKELETSREELISELKSSKLELLTIKDKANQLSNTNTNLSSEIQRIIEELNKSDAVIAELEQSIELLSSPDLPDMQAKIPIRSAYDVIGIFSNTYDINDVILNGLDIVPISESDQVIRLNNFSNGTISLDNSKNGLDLLGMTHFHFYYYSLGVGTLNITLQSPSEYSDQIREYSHSLTIDKKNEWVSEKILLKEFGNVDMENIYKVKLESEGSDVFQVYLDELYFFFEETTSEPSEIVDAHVQEVEVQSPYQENTETSLNSHGVNAEPLQNQEGTNSTNISPILNFTEKIPLGGNAWIISNDLTKNNKVINDKGISSWNDLNDIIRIYFRVEITGELHLGLSAKSRGGNSTIQVNFGNQSKEITIGNTDFEEIDIGIFNISDKGYHFVELRGINKSSTFIADVNDLLIGGPVAQGNIVYVEDDFYYGRRGPTIHLRYNSVSSDIEWFYSELTVVEGEDTPGTFFMPNGFTNGYFGIQVISPTEKRILFSIWSSYRENDPNSIADEYKVVTLESGNGVTINEFGNEGTGLQSYKNFDWSAGMTYKFLVKGVPTTTNSTEYTAYFFAPENGKWELIASFRKPQVSENLSGFISFVENFKTESGFLSRKAIYDNQWVRDTNGKWFELTEAKITVDRIGSNGARLDYSAGIENGAFYLKNCGFFNEDISINTFINRQNSASPNIDFSTLK